jgi:2-polyprenyl-3-methyl-5-hydroxy-6-metoxy-1,4-benzoquinol methylase
VPQLGPGPSLRIDGSVATSTRNDRSVACGVPTSGIDATHAVFPELEAATTHLVDLLSGSAPELADDLTSFVARSDFSATAARSNEELFDAQRLARALLLETKNYDAVYTWYGAFKVPTTTTDAAGVDAFATGAFGCRDSFGFIEGHHAVLEVGAGAAPIGLALAARNTSWLATDILIDEQFEAVAQIVGKPANLRYEQANAVDLDGIRSGSMDVVVSRSFIEHLLVEDVHRFLGQCHRVLEPGGTVVVFCPSSVGPPAEVTRHFPQYRSVQGLHIQEWTVSELAEVLGEHGFTDVRSRFLSFRGLDRLPSALSRRNSIGLRTAVRLERLARRTNGMVYGGGWTAKVWTSLWGHLGAASTSVTATRAS